MKPCHVFVFVPAHESIYERLDSRYMYGLTAHFASNTTKRPQCGTFSAVQSSFALASTRRVIYSLITHHNTRA